VVQYPISERNEFTLRFGAVPELITGYLNGQDGTHTAIEDTRITRNGFSQAEGSGVDLLEGFLLLLTPLTAMFLHGGWFHIIGNMLFLWVFGYNVEDRLGHVRFGVFYLLVGYAAAAAHIWIGDGGLLPMIGASGAISGVLGAYLLLFPRALVQVLIPIIFLIPAVIPAPLMIGFWFFMNVVNGVIEPLRDASGSGGTAWFAHIGGFAAGLILIYPFLIGKWRAPIGETGPRWNMPVGVQSRFLRMPGRGGRSGFGGLGRPGPRGGDSGDGMGIEPVQTSTSEIEARVRSETSDTAGEAERFRVIDTKEAPPRVDRPWASRPAEPSKPARRVLFKGLGGKRWRKRLKRRPDPGGVEVFRGLPGGDPGQSPGDGPGEGTG
jgi:membrane associated rhomboid family serine protease